MMLWTANELLEATGGQSPNTQWSASGVSIDTRTLEKGDVFIAISGDNFNANNFIKTAFEKGASGAIVSTLDVNCSLPQIIVDDTNLALRGMGIYSRARLQGEVIGITGSVGKTSVKDTLQKVLKNYGKTYATVGNLNNHFGVPLTLSRIPKNTRYAIVEMGMSALGEIADLTSITRPTCAIVNTVEKAHLEFFTGIEQIAKAKAEIFQGLQDGTAVYNINTNCSDILHHAIKKQGVNYFTFGENENANLQLLSTTQTKNGQSVLASLNGKEFVFDLPNLGHHRAYNACAVLSILASIGIDPEIACKHLSTIAPTIGRGASALYPVNGGEVLVYDETYNGAPASMHASLQVLAQTPCQGRRIAILGDMLALGEDSISLHKEIKESILKHDIDLVLSCGKHMKYLQESLPIQKRGLWAENSKILSQSVVECLSPNDVVVIKGSADSKMKLIVNKIAGDL